MTAEDATAVRTGGIGLLERAISYALGSLRLVTPPDLANPTPCQDWDLRTLLEHLADSMDALYEAVEPGQVGLDSPAGRGQDDPVAAVRQRARLLLGAWTGAEGNDPVSIAGRPLTSGIVTCTGAVEVAVHGWDVATACRAYRPIPAALAGEILPLASLVVTEQDRPARFAAPLPAVGPAPGERLLAFLGRKP
ncbi:TIGR03086 family metal-binding protein [Amycolatopsis aidingensis]|uniref:TIGR03086 family metal-binding protein n=1 Tax=Amycolatopsis aidingensis TaxID=2842453 RepID=UPI001C0AFE62|nr:TIGR03086 family metal-binding protein [Amycolatopsis aidingensis]